MPTLNVETEDPTRLKALRKAAQVGFEALERGKFKEFDSIADLEGYLNELGEKIISDPNHP
jgi:antitoxin ParD1/3/4